MANKPKKKEKTAVGRPTKYKEQYNELAYKFCLLGATDEELGIMFDVEKSTIENWKLDYPEFLDSIKRGKEIADSEVANRLYKRALGYEHEEDEIMQYQGQPIIIPTIKHYPPDSTAAIFWLKNRRPKNWRDKQEVDLSNSDGTLSNLHTLTTEELIKRAEALKTIESKEK